MDEFTTTKRAYKFMSRVGQVKQGILALNVHGNFWQDIFGAEELFCDER